MALMSYQQVQITGPALTYSAVASSDTVAPSQRGFVHVKTGATSTNVTVVVPGTEYGQARADVTVAVGTNTERMIGPLVPDLADPTTGLVTIQYSATASVTSAAVQV